MSVLWYVPLPPYKERYSEYVSTEWGVVETAIRKSNIECVVLRPSELLYTVGEGRVLNPAVMCEWGFWQTQKIVEAILKGTMKENDVIYFEDFWHPGFEMVPYTLSIAGMMGKVRLASYNFAQSIDKNDFTFKLMRLWIPGLERTYAERIYDDVFCASSNHQRLMEENWPECNARFAGTVYNSEIVRAMQDTPQYLIGRRRRWVIYSSRLDEEKDPHLFLDIVEKTYAKDPTIQFIICSGQKPLKGLPSALERLENIQLAHPGLILVLYGLDKAVYFGWLQQAAVQLNTAHQDFVSYTLLEATTFGCIPFYPSSNESFQEAMGQSQELLYDREDVDGTVDRLIQLVNYGTILLGQDFSWIYYKYDFSINRILYRLGFNVAMGPSISTFAKGTYESAQAWDAQFRAYKKELVYGSR